MADAVDITVPQSVETSAGKVVNPGLGEQIAGDRYNKAKAARAVTLGGAIFGKIIPAASVPDQQGTGVGGVEFDQPG